MKRMRPLAMYPPIWARNAALVAAFALVSSAALAQNAPATAAEGDTIAPETRAQAQERHLAEGLDMEAHLVEDRAPRAQVIRFEQGLEILAENSLDIESAKQALVVAGILEDQARAAFAPTVNVTARVAINDPVVKLPGANPLAPLIPYLDSVYDNDPALQAQLAANPELPNARELARVEYEDSVLSPRFDYRASLTVTQPLYNGRFFPARRLADLAERQAHAAIEQATFYTQQAYTQIYFQAVGLQRYSDIAKANVETSRLTLERAQKLFEARAGSEVDLTRAEVAYLTALSDYENANIAYALALEAMATLLRVEPNFDVVEPEALATPASVEEMIETAFQERSELAVAELEVEAADIEAAQARSAFQPYVFAQGQANVVPVTALSGRAVTWNISLNLSWDLWDGGQARRARRSAEVAGYQAEIRRAQLEDQIRNEIRTAWLTMRTQENVVRRAEATANIAQINYDVTLRARELGAGSSLEIDVAQNALFQANLALADAQTQRLAAIYELYRLQGNAYELVNTAQ